MSVLTMWLITVSLLLTPCLISAREIRQEVFAHIDGSVRLPASPTFLVTGSRRVNRLACDQGPGNAKTACQISLVRFALASDEPAEEEVNRLLKSLKACAVSTAAPLVVTGHACILGDMAGNLELSRARARSVASSLEAHGYTVGWVEGLGSTEPLGGNLEVNRRVAVALARP
jgi:outer membrane protein OmpA-like peptidoglycan-associated protein